MTGKFSELDMYYFGQGTHYEIYKQMGCRLSFQQKYKQRSVSRLQITAYFSFLIPKRYSQDT